jgi:hypothetical protein
MQPFFHYRSGGLIYTIQTNHEITDLMRADFGGIFIRVVVSFEGDNLTKIY